MNFNEIIFVMAMAIAYTENFRDAFLWGQINFLREYPEEIVNKMFTIPEIAWEWENHMYSLEYIFDIRGYGDKPSRYLLFFKDGFRMTLKELRELFLAMNTIGMTVPEINFETIKRFMVKFDRERREPSAHRKSVGEYILSKTPQINWHGTNPTWVSKLVIPCEVKVPEGFFSRCPHLKEVEIMGECTRIPRGYFKNCWGLRKVLLHGHGPYEDYQWPIIEEGAFEGCPHVEIFYDKEETFAVKNALWWQEIKMGRKSFIETLKAINDLEQNWYKISNEKRDWYINFKHSMTTKEKTFFSENSEKLKKYFSINIEDPEDNILWIFDNKIEIQEEENEILFEENVAHGGKGIGICIKENGPMGATTFKDKYKNIIPDPYNEWGNRLTMDEASSGFSSKPLSIAEVFLDLCEGKAE